MRLILAWIFAGAACFAQPPLDASLEGVVIGGGGITLAEATLTLSSGVPDKDIEATNDTAGRFRFAGMRPGNYRIFAKNDGYIDSPAKRGIVEAPGVGKRNRYSQHDYSH